MSEHFYPVGTAGKAWGDEERAQWLAMVGDIKRAYADEVLSKLDPLKASFDVEQYGALSQDQKRFALLCSSIRSWVTSAHPPARRYYPVVSARRGSSH